MACGAMAALCGLLLPLAAGALRAQRGQRGAREKPRLPLPVPYPGWRNSDWKPNPADVMEKMVRDWKKPFELSRDCGMLGLTLNRGSGPEAEPILQMLDQATSYLLDGDEPQAAITCLTAQTSPAVFNRPYTLMLNRTTRCLEHTCKLLRMFSDDRDIQKNHLSSIAGAASSVAPELTPTMAAAGCFEVLFHAIEHFSTDADVMMSAWRGLSDHSHNSFGAERIANHGGPFKGIRFMVDQMRAYPDPGFGEGTDTLTLKYEILQNVQGLLEADQAPAYAREFVANGLVDQVLALLRIEDKWRASQDTGCRALESLLLFNPSMADYVVDNGVIELVKKAITTFHDSDPTTWYDGSEFGDVYPVIPSCVGVLDKISSINASTFLRMEAAGVWELMNSVRTPMRLKVRSFTEKYAKAVKPHQVWEKSRINSEVDNIVGSMKRQLGATWGQQDYATDSQIIIDSCSSLADVATKHDSTEEDAMDALKQTEHIIEFLLRHKGLGEALTACIKYEMQPFVMIQDPARAKRYWNQFVNTTDGIERYVQYLRNNSNPGDAETESRLLPGLGFVLQMPEFLSMFRAEGGVDFLFDALKIFENNTEVVTQLWFSISGLTFTSVGMRIVAHYGGQFEGIRLLLKKLREQPDEPVGSVYDQFTQRFSFLRSFEGMLASEAGGELAGVLAAGGAAELALDAIRIEKEARATQEMGCRVLNSLVDRDESIIQAIVNHDGVETTHMAMMQWPYKLKEAWFDSTFDNYYQVIPTCAALLRRLVRKGDKQAILEKLEELGAIETFKAAMMEDFSTEETDDLHTLGYLLFRTLRGEDYAKKSVFYSEVLEIREALLEEPDNLLLAQDSCGQLANVIAREPKSDAALRLLDQVLTHLMPHIDRPRWKEPIYVCIMSHIANAVFDRNFTLRLNTETNILQNQIRALNSLNYSKDEENATIWLLANLAGLAGGVAPELTPKVVSMGGLDVAFRALETFKGKEQVMTSAWGTLADHASVRVGAEAIVNHGGPGQGIKYMMDQMKMSPGAGFGERDDQTAKFEILRCAQGILTATESDNYLSEMLREGIVNQTIYTMSVEGEYRASQEMGCSLLAVFLKARKQVAQEVLDLGGPELFSRGLEINKQYKAGGTSYSKAVNSHHKVTGMCMHAIWNLLEAAPQSADQLLKLGVNESLQRQPAEYELWAGKLANRLSTAAKTGSV